MRLPPDLQAEIDQDAAVIRNLIDAHPEIAVELQGETELGKLLQEWGKVVAASIFGAGREAEMNHRALAWIDYLGGL